jgi:hypothetical protein
MDLPNKTISVDLTRAQVKYPSVDTQQPVDRRYTEYCATIAPLPDGALRQRGALPCRSSLSTAIAGDSPELGGDPHLRSTQAITGYYIEATDGDIGHVNDVLIEDRS